MLHPVPPTSDTPYGGDVRKEKTLIEKSDNKVEIETVRRQKVRTLPERRKTTSGRARYSLLPHDIKDVGNDSCYVLKEGVLDEIALLEKGTFFVTAH